VKDGAAWDRWATAFFALHLVQTVAVARMYPFLAWDTDLVAYLVYFRNWLEGSTGLHSVAFFPVPKPLLVFLLGPLGTPARALWCSAMVSGALGSVAYLLGREVFGRAVGVLLSAFLLLDVEKALLAARSKADLYLALFLLLAVYLAVRRRLIGSAICLFLSALVKPVTVPCALWFLFADGPRRTRWLATLVPFAAIPLVLVSNHLLVGSALGPARFFSGFTALRDGAAIGSADVLRFVLWTQLVRHAFAATAPFGFVGLAFWLAHDRRRLASPVIALPMLFLAGWVLLGAVSPYAPFFRFYWPLQVWFLGFILFGMLRTAAWLGHGNRRLAGAIAVALLVALVGDHVTASAGYRDRLVLPFEHAMEFLGGTTETLRHERRPGETVVAPLAFVPYLMLALDVRDAGMVVPVGAPLTRPPDWIVYLPEPGADEALARLTTEGGYEVRASDGRDALLALPTAARLGA
jgi:hypothetical protein